MNEQCMSKVFRKRQQQSWYIGLTPIGKAVIICNYAERTSLRREKTTERVREMAAKPKIRILGPP